MHKCKYNSVNMKLLALQFEKLKSATKHDVGVTLRLLINMVGNANIETI